MAGSIIRHAGWKVKGGEGQSTALSGVAVLHGETGIARGMRKARKKQREKV
jgi:hypothetical protein